MNLSFLNLFMKWLTRGRVVSDDFCQHLLADRGCDRLWTAFLAEIGQQEERAGQALFARVEQLIDQVRLNVAIARQQVSHEQLAQGRLVLQDAEHFGLFNPHHIAVGHGSGYRQTQRLPHQAALAKELAGAEQADHRFLALVGRDCDLDLALLDVKHGVPRASLREDDGILAIAAD
jgi:hypothetical protein